jgi:transposase
MALYCGIDLHSDNLFLVILDEQDRAQVQRKLPLALATVLGVLEPHRDELTGVAVESTFNWYWLVDGLMEAGYRVDLVNTWAAKQYDGLKFTDDRHDARWLAHLMRLGILPTGYIYPKAQRPLRDLTRQRGRLVRQRTANLLSVQNTIARETGEMVKGNALKKLTEEEIAERLPTPELVLQVDARRRVIAVLDEQIQRIEKLVQAHGALRPEFRILRSMKGIGLTLGLTIMYETGDIGRFDRVGRYASYCRCVPAERRSNQRKKGEGNRKNGNPYLSWAFSEAAHFARRFQPQAKKFYDRKLARRGRLIAERALAHKLCRATYFMLRDQVPYDPGLLFR